MFTFIEESHGLCWFVPTGRSLYVIATLYQMNPFDTKYIKTHGNLPLIGMIGPENTFEVGVKYHLSVDVSCDNDVDTCVGLSGTCVSLSGTCPNLSGTCPNIIKYFTSGTYVPVYWRGLVDIVKPETWRVLCQDPKINELVRLTDQKRPSLRPNTISMRSAYRIAKFQPDPCPEESEEYPEQEPEESDIGGTDNEENLFDAIDEDPVGEIIDDNNDPDFYYRH